MTHATQRQVSVLLALALLPAVTGAVARAAGPDPFDQSKVPIEVQPTDPKLTKIVLIAGGPGVGHGPGEHEHFAGSALLMKMLQQTPGVFPVLARDGWPKSPETLKDAKTVVFYMDGGGKQSTIEHRDEIQKLMDAGVGIVHIHQVIDYSTEPSRQAVQWLGGAYEPKTGARGHWVGDFKTFPDHPVTRGVEPFSLMDGWILKLRFVPDMKGVTPILRTGQPPAKPKAAATQPAKAAAPALPTDDVVCWAYERDGGGRAFVLTGGHEHKNWGITGLRRLTINGILWTAKVEVPKEGAPVDLDPADLNTNLERKPQKAVKPPATKPAAKAVQS